MTPAVPAIELVKATKRYGETIALDAVSLVIEAGEFFCLLGPSGCGKTTTLNLIGGFIPLSDGELRIEGRLVNDLPPHRRSVNTVFQSYALFPHMTVAQNVAFGLRMEGLARRESEARVEEYLGLVGLERLAARRPAELSGGQQQRVALARALAKRPAVLLLDEPLGALDLKLRRQMQAELSRIHRQVGTTFVFVTHDQEEALSMATRIAVMTGGHVAQVGTPREIYDHPADRFVADFIGESNFLDGQVRASDAGMVFELPDGRPLPVSPSAALGPGTLMVRPGSTRVGTPPGTPGVATLPGRIEHVGFLGDRIRIIVATTAGAIVVDRPRGFGVEEEPVGGPGEEACVWWPIERSTVL